MSRAEVLTDEMWAQIEPLLPPLKGWTGRPRAPYRPLIEGAIFRLRTGVAWRDPPAEFGPWQTVWKRQYESCNGGTWDRVLTALQTAADARGEGGQPRTDALASRLATTQAALTGQVADPTDLPFSDDLLDDDELVDETKVRAAVDDLMTRKPHLAARRP